MSTHILRAAVCAVTVTLLPGGLAAQANAERARRLDSIASSEVTTNHAVGYVVAVTREANTLLFSSYGKAAIEGNVPMTVHTILPIGSVTKQFTAVAVLQLQDKGTLTLDDQLTRWLPELQSTAAGVTLRHLLGHTAGMKDLAEMQEVRTMRLLRNPAVSRDSVSGIVGRYPLQFAPGTVQRYSNTNYWLLGRVIERASGMSYEEYLQREIFSVLGMSRSSYCPASGSSGDRAVGHGVRDGQAVPIPPIVHTATFAAGAICSTAGDLIRWLQALHGGKVLSPSSYAELIAPTTLTDGTPTRYAKGLTVWKDPRGLATIGHSGGGFGYSSQLWWHPERQLAVVVLTNSEPDNTTTVAEALTDAVLGSPAPARAYPGNVRPLLGTYRGQGQGKEMTIVVGNGEGGLTAAIDGGAPRALRWVEGLTFGLPATHLIFRGRSGSESMAELRFDTGGDHLILQRVP
jgi:D-alanyl-D-alanine carboxypeptidase